MGKLGFLSQWLIFLESLMLAASVAKDCMFAHTRYPHWKFQYLFQELIGFHRVEKFLQAYNYYSILASREQSNCINGDVDDDGICDDDGGECVHSPIASRGSGLETTSTVNINPGTLYF